jgi:hypothetical protein
MIWRVFRRGKTSFSKTENFFPEMIPPGYVLFFIANGNNIYLMVDNKNNRSNKIIFCKREKYFWYVGGPLSFVQRSVVD